MPWYGWVFALPLWATMLWSFVELALPLLLLVGGLVRWMFFVRAALVFAASLWAFACLGTIVPAAVVLANADGYRPATFTVQRHVEAGDPQTGGSTRYTEGVVDGRHAERYGPAAGVPVGGRLAVLYNPDVSGGARVVEPTDDLAGREGERLAKWAALGLGPWVVALAVRLRWRASLQPDGGHQPTLSAPSP